MVAMVPEPVRLKALNADAGRWLAELPGLVADLERDWSVVVGRVYPDATEAFVAEATLADGTPAVLKALVPRAGNSADHEITALRLSNGDGCVRLLRHDSAREALLLERLGPSLADLAVPIERRQRILCSVASRMWRPAPDSGLPTGAEKGRWLADFIVRTWEDLGRPCPERAVDHALTCAERRIAAHDLERAVLVHGDLHQWNTLQAGTGFKLVDPDGLLAEAEYDLGVLMREDPVELLHGDPRERAHHIAAMTGRDANAAWEWGVVERVSTGLLLYSLDMQPVAREMLAAAGEIAERYPRFP
jgi:streptomycin 6-kinase